MNYLNFVQTTAAMASIAMIVIGSRWLKRYLRTLVR